MQLLVITEWQQKYEGLRLCGCAEFLNVRKKHPNHKGETKNSDICYHMPFDMGILSIPEYLDNSRIYLNALMDVFGVGKDI